MFKLQINLNCFNHNHCHPLFWIKAVTSNFITFFWNNFSSYIMHPSLISAFSKIFAETRASINVANLSVFELLLAQFDFQKLELINYWIQELRNEDLARENMGLCYRKSKELIKLHYDSDEYFMTMVLLAMHKNIKLTLW